MPKILDDCVNSLLAEWKKNPEDAPKRTKDGKPIKTAKDRKAVAHAICTASLKKAGKMSDSDVMSLEKVGPTILGAAATNRPHIKGLPIISFVQRMGKEMLRIPLLVLGKWRSRYGLLDFTLEKIGRMIDNFYKNVVGIEISFDNRHKPELGAIAWFRDFTLEQEDGKKLLVGYADPTEKGKTEIESGAYKYASIEFHPDYENPLVEALSSDDLEVYIEREDDVDEVTTDTNAGQLHSDVDERTTTLESQVQELLDKVKALGEQNVALSGDLQTAQGRAVKLEAFAKKQFVRTVVLEAQGYRDGDGRAHPKVFLDWLEDVLVESDVGEGDNTVSLGDDTGSAEAIRAYYGKAICWLAQNMPGQVPMVGAGTKPDQTKPIGAGDDGEVKFSEEAVKEIADAWSLAGGSG